MKISKLMSHIRLDFMRLLKVCNRVKLEQLKIGIVNFCRQYHRTKLGIGLSVCIILTLVAFLLQPGAELQKIMKPDGKEQQIVTNPTGPQEELSKDVQQRAVADRTGGSETSRGGQADRESVHLLAQVIEGEAADESYQGKVAVGAVILNRTESVDFPHTIPGVIYERDAFESVSNGQYQRHLSQDSINAAVDALNGSDPTGGALYFWNPAKSSSTWVWSRPIVTQIGRHVFAR
ncbi:MAG: cell wall hydrolase [Desulfotomaculaceae bacterium]|nr:cell wall hydrolase [Desulfotomaculaceae bacterium]